MELEELQKALNWLGVHQGRDCLVVSFNEVDAIKIQGLKANEQCYYLDYPEFEKTVVSFLITSGNTTYQYWVRGDRLHRIGAPAKIVVSTNIIQQCYFENGLAHSDIGPAEVIIRGSTLTNIHPVTQMDVGSDYIINEWDEYEGYWFERGEPSKYPLPHSICITSGFHIFRITGTPVLNDVNGNPALVAKSVTTNWTREGNMLETDTFRIRQILVNDYSRYYTNGIPTKHTCGDIPYIGWIDHGDIIQSSDKARKTIHTDLFSEWNIIDGPVFPNDQELVFAMQEAFK